MRFTRTLRFRLTAWYGLALAAGLMVFGATLVGLAERHLLRTHDETMAFRGHAALFILAQESRGQNLTPTQTDHLAHLGRVAISQVDRSGERLIYRALDLFNAPVLTRSIEAEDEQEGNGRFSTVIENGDYWRTYTIQYRVPGGPLLHIKTLEELGNVDAALKRLRLAFFHLVPIGLLVSLFGAYVLSTKALAPVSNIIKLSHEIEADQLSRRLPHPGVHDEIGSLVDTLNHMLARMEASFEAMKRFTADASHELRNPLATLRNIVDVTLEVPRTSEEKDAALHSIGEEVDRIRNLVEDLLLLARADSGRVIMQMRPVSLSFLLEAQTEAFQLKAQERNIRLQIHELPPDEVMGNERWLLQVVGNLLSNAINYTPEGGIVTVAMARSKDSVEFSVSDTGSGIPEEDLERIFERFFRSDPSRSWGHVQGQGLGLAIVAWVVGEHGAHIRAANRPGGGAVFTVTFPQNEQPSV